MSEDDQPYLGRCCNCTRDGGVRNIFMLHRRAPVAGTGWGCVVCDLAQDGAVAVLCDDCAALDDPPRFVCLGYPAANARMPYGDLAPDVFDHDRTKHADDD